MTRRRRFRRFRPLKGLPRRALRASRSAPRAAKVAAGIFCLVVLWASANWTYQALRKPTELLFPVSGALAKTPYETWREYGAQFRKHATAVITPEFLAALAQIEASGNPLARTYWRWHPSWHPFELYRPASSAVGMYQITDATFAQTTRECRRESAVIGDRPSSDPGSCWFESLYRRVAPEQAIELTAQRLDRAVATTLKRKHVAVATLEQRQELAAVIHLCGPRPGEQYAQRHFRLVEGQRCGDHEVRAYLARVNAMKRRFARLAGAA